MKTVYPVSEFAALCVENGFAKLGKVFSRCLGDAIYQSISIASSDYVNSESPEYTPTSKKSPCIRIGIWSMYSNLPAFYFSDRRFIGEFYPENFMGASFGTSTFMGFASECEIMRKIGFQALNSITTQKQLIDITYKLQQAQYGSVLPHQLFLCAPLILCGEYSTALNQLYGIYAQNWLNFHAENDHLKNEGRLDEYIEYESSLQKNMQEITTFLHIMIGKRHTDIKAYLISCLNNNIQFANKHSVAFCDNFLPFLNG